VAVERTPIPEDLRQRVLAAIAVEIERDKAEALRSVQEQSAAGERAGTRERAAFGVLRRAGKRAVSGEPGDIADKAASLGDKATAGGWAGFDEVPAAAEVVSPDELAGAVEVAAPGELAGFDEVAAPGELAGFVEAAGLGEPAGFVEAADFGEPAGPAGPVAAGDRAADQRASAALENAGTGVDTGARPGIAAPAAGIPLADGTDTAGSAGQTAAADDDAGGSGGAALAGSAWFTSDRGGAGNAGQPTAHGLADDAAVVDGSWLTGAAARADDAPSLGYGIIAGPGDYAAAPGPGSGPEYGVTGRPPGPEAGGAADADEEEAARPEVTLPRRAPGENGAPAPPAHLRRDCLPPSLLERRLDPEAHTEPIPRISGFHPDDPAGPAASPPTSAWTFADITPRASQAPPDVAVPPAGAGPSAAPAPPGDRLADPAGPPAALAGAPALAAVAAPPQTAPAPADPAPAVPVRTDTPPYQAGPAADGPPAQSPPTMSWLAASPGAAEPSAATPSASSPSGTMPPATEPPATGPDAPELAPYSWPPGSDGTGQDNGGPHVGNGLARPGSGRAAGTAAPHPSAPPPPARPAGPKAPPRRRRGRPYRVAGLVMSVVALVAAGAVALVMSGRGPAHHAGPGALAPGAGTVRDRAVAWVASQVSRTAVVACDPVTCQALRAHGVPASSLYQLGSRTTSPLRAQVIVATAPVRNQFGRLLGSVYAPGVLASFGSGANRIEVRLTAPHGAAAYRAMLRSALLSRKAAGTELLHSGRIMVTAVARRALAAGQVDGRLLLTIAQMAAVHPMFIVDFGPPAPGASAGLPLRQADIAEGAHAHRHLGRVASAGYVRSMVAFLRAQRGQYRPASVRSLHLADGAAVLRILFTAPSPPGLLGPHA
jgi:hypothetical protein